MLILPVLLFTVSVLFTVSCSNPSKIDDEETRIRDSIALEYAKANGFVPIYTFLDLCNIGKSKDLPLDTNYMLMRDIDAYQSRTMNNWQGFEPIGMRKENGHIYTDAFSGKFYGDRRVIKNLHINRPPQDSAAAGLFGVINGAVISHLTIENSHISGRRDAGGIAGRAENSYMDSCSFEGTVSGDRWVGGIAGSAFASKIYRAFSIGTVSNDSTLGNGGGAGGLVGSLTDGAELVRSFSEAHVKGGHNTGGLVGENYRSVIAQSYSAGSASGNFGYTGGLVGHIHDGNVWECYSIAEVIFTPPGKAGGLVGQASVKTEVWRSYWDMSSSGIDVSHGGTILKDTVIIIDGEPVDTSIRTSGEYGIDDTPLMMKQSTYDGWNFKTVWKIDEGKSTPYFRWREDYDGDEDEEEDDDDEEDNNDDEEEEDI